MIINEEFVKKLAGDKPIIIKTIPFLNYDVPKYLENLKKFREESEKVIIVVNK